MLCWQALGEHEAFKGDMLAFQFSSPPREYQQFHRESSREPTLRRPPLGRLKCFAGQHLENMRPLKET